MKAFAGLIGAFLVLAGILAAVYGWAINIIKVLGLMGGPIAAELLVRVIGIFVFPLGAVAGFF